MSITETTESGTTRTTHPAPATRAQAVPTQTTPTPRGPWAGRVVLAARGALVGAFLGVALATLLPWPLQKLAPLCAACGAILALTRLRRFTAGAAVSVLAVMALVAFTPVVKPLLRQLERSDPPTTAPAVVVLGGGAFKDGNASAATEDRLLHGYGVLCRGEAPVLVLTWSPAVAKRWDEVARAQMRGLGLHYTVEVVGPARNTHDEAMAVADLARQRGWGRVILVTDPWHMRRAAATFQKAGVGVICSPCVDRTHDLHDLDDPEDRLAVFRLWVRETCGYSLYKMRGWV
jgi:uncharacterized SAM-binding protein YcdF (DUF218 family)